MECTIGGTRRHLVDLALGQARAGESVGVVAAGLRDPGMLEDFELLRQGGVLVERLDMVRSIRPATDWKHARALRRLLAKHQPAIVHSHSSKAGVLARRASLATGIGKRVHTPHTMAFLFAELFSPLKRALFRRIETSLARTTDRMIAVSEGEAETLRASGVLDPARLRVVPNGIDARAYAQAEPLDLAELGLDPERPTMVLVGLVYAAKGHDLAIQALAGTGLASDTSPLDTWQLLCVGPGDGEPYRAAAQRLGVGERVVFSGARNDVPRILASVQALVLPSRWEGMPYVVLEAMASGLPVVAHPVDGARDVLGGSNERDARVGILTREIGVPALRAGLEELAQCTPAERKAMGERAREHVRAHYSVEEMVRRTLAVYAEIA